MTGFQSPAECTLPTAEQPIREGEFAALFDTALDATRVDRQWLRVSFSGADGVATKVRDLTRRESKCCTFFEFTIARSADRVVLDVRVPPARAEVLDGLAGLLRGTGPEGTRAGAVPRVCLATTVRRCRGGTGAAGR